ncbi:MAG: hypothetical protein RLZZ453_136 [Chlamydiota bacterium]|jgi:hypothetical protein
MKRFFLGLSVLVFLVSVFWVTRLFEKKPMPSVSYHLTAALSSYWFPMPVTFSSCHIPIVEFTIEGSSYPAELDLGCHGTLDLPQDILNALPNKTPKGTSTSFGIRGKQYISPSYLLPAIQIGPVTFRDITVSEQNLEFEKDLILKESTTEKNSYPCRIGWKLFNITNSIARFFNFYDCLLRQLRNSTREGVLL